MQTAMVLHEFLKLLLNYSIHPYMLSTVWLSWQVNPTQAADTG